MEHVDFWGWILEIRKMVRPLSKLIFSIFHYHQLVYRKILVYMGSGTDWNAVRVVFTTIGLNVGRIAVKFPAAPFRKFWVETEQNGAKLGHLREKKMCRFWLEKRRLCVAHLDFLGVSWEISKIDRPPSILIWSIFEYHQRVYRKILVYMGRRPPAKIGRVVFTTIGLRQWVLTRF